ncbi:hypothetical protein L3081_10485 [Colwellia sp. MSW7]|uniref:Uncharacterized protein n=1 Tax=Colwellia maritima TaxID=2912588 RepID=A0ABS9X0J9_9GAMM|nr:hypothetical protein [Colwellia maritima]MCI2283748.1 hypothetical protein [Colwellia maritima]
MGAQFFFGEVVTANDNKGSRFKCEVEVVDNHGVPELRIGPEDEAYNGSIAEFDDWEQFEKFVQAVNDLHFRLSPKK